MRPDNGCDSMTDEAPVSAGRVACAFLYEARLGSASQLLCGGLRVAGCGGVFTDEGEFAATAPRRCDGCLQAKVA
jgi:hypothetical protein